MPTGLKGSVILLKSIFAIILTLLLISLVAACAAPAAISKEPNSPETNTNKPAASTLAPTTPAAAAKPQGELVAALPSFGNENFLPWIDPTMASLDTLVYDMLIYYDHINRKLLPGLAESWENSPDGLTLIYHLRKGVQFSDGWGELTSEDVKYNFEMQASPKSTGKAAQCRRIASMDTPDPYTLVIHFKDPYHTFYLDLSMANSGVCQGILSKKYIETVGEDVASQKPIGTGPYRFIESKSGNYMKFDAVEDNWRVVPEFKTLVVRLVAETSTLVAALKTKEIDLALVPADQVADLKAAGVATELNPIGGGVVVVSLGGMIIPEDKRYDATLHNKDPWADVRIRRAMSLAIDRAGICKAIFAGYADAAGVPLLTVDSKKYQYPYDPAAARQLLKDAGYPNGFSFRAISYKLGGVSETPRIVEALAGYWQQIGLNPRITVIDYNTYNTKNAVPCKTAGDVSLFRISVKADMLDQAALNLMPNAVAAVYEDEGSYAIYQNNPKATMEERSALVDKLNQYYYDNVCPIPVVRVGNCYAWNSDKISPWPHHDSTNPYYLEYPRHAVPLNTYRLFNPWPDR